MEESVFKRTISNKVSVVIFILYGTLLFLCGLMSLVIYQGTTRTQKFFVYDIEPSILKEVDDQYQINNALNKIVNNNNYTLSNAYVELNPYGNSPLSAIIIFQTKDEEQIRVYINNEYKTTMELSKKHIIPIYGLYEDYENVIRLESSSASQEYKIVTENSNINYPINNKSVEYINGITFISGNNITGWDKDKKLKFYLTGDYKNDIDFLPNGHMVLGVSDAGINNNYIGIIEIDYLGKIYNFYALPNGYSHELQVLSNGNIMISGKDKSLYGINNVIYEIDPRTGNKVNEINVSNITNGVYNQVLTINDFYYDETNKTISIAFDEINKILVITDTNSSWLNNKEIHDKRVVIDNKLYRLYNAILYDEITPNISINDLKEYNKIPKDALDESSYRRIDLDKSEYWNNSVVFTKNTFITDYQFNEDDKVDLYLVNKAGKIFILRNCTGRVFNLELPVGQYALFVKVNDNLYRTNRVYQFK